MSACTLPALRRVTLLLMVGFLVSCQGQPPKKSEKHTATAAPARSPSPSAAAPPSAPPTTAPDSAPTRHEQRATARAARYGVPLRSDAELDALLAGVCQAAQGDHKPVIVDFGADWCPDCFRLHGLLHHPVLQTTLESFHLVQLNLGEDHHERLRKALSVKAIPRWFVFRPTSCDAPVEQWPQVANRLLERTPSAQDLSQWLRAIL